VEGEGRTPPKKNPTPPKNHLILLGWVSLKGGGAGNEVERVVKKGPLGKRQGGNPGNGKGGGVRLRNRVQGRNRHAVPENKGRKKKRDVRPRLLKNMKKKVRIQESTGTGWGKPNRKKGAQRQTLQRGREDIKRNRYKKD